MVQGPLAMIFQVDLQSPSVLDRLDQLAGHHDVVACRFQPLEFFRQIDNFHLLVHLPYVPDRPGLENARSDFSDGHRYHRLFPSEHLTEPPGCWPKGSLYLGRHLVIVSGLLAQGLLNWTLKRFQLRIPYRVQIRHSYFRRLHQRPKGRRLNKRRSLPGTSVRVASLIERGSGGGDLPDRDLAEIGGEDDVLGVLQNSVPIRRSDERGASAS